MKKKELKKKLKKSQDREWQLSGKYDKLLDRVAELEKDLRISKGNHTQEELIDALVEAKRDSMYYSYY
jgi:heme oxygenase